jgi:hypothetical protein
MRRSAKCSYQHWQSVASHSDNGRDGALFERNRSPLSLFAAPQGSRPGRTDTAWNMLVPPAVLPRATGLGWVRALGSDRNHITHAATATTAINRRIQLVIVPYPHVQWLFADLLETRCSHHLGLASTPRHIDYSPTEPGYEKSRSILFDLLRS